MKLALRLALVVAIGLAAAAPGVVLAPRLKLEPVRDTPWEGAWSTLAVEANGARTVALTALSRTAWAAGIAALLVAGLTVLTLSLARAAQRRTDIVVRRAVGASRRALAREALQEGGIIALGGLVLGGGAGAVVVFLLGRAWPGGLGDATAAPVLWSLGLGAVVVLGALLPLKFARPRAPGVHATGSGVPLLVPVTQFGLGLLGLLAGAQLSHRAVTPVVSAAPAAPAATGVVFPLSFDTSRTVPVILDSVLRAMRADSSITLASIHSPGTLLGLGQVDVITTECGRCYQGGIATPLRVVQATNHLATADTFRAIGLHLVAGRLLADGDRQGAERVAVVNRFLAERQFEGGRAVGRQVRVGGPDNWYRVVGIVEDGQFEAVGAGALPLSHVYLSALQHQATELEALVRGASLPGGTPFADVIEREQRAARWFAGTLTFAGWGALLLSAVGMLTVMHLWVSGLLPELGLRRAVGARRRHVLGRIVVRALAVAGGGAALAWWLEPLGSAAVARAVTHARAGGGGLTLVSVPLLAMLGATLAATLGPAWRAARTAPATLSGFTDL